MACRFQRFFLQPVRRAVAFVQRVEPLTDVVLRMHDVRAAGNLAHQRMRAVDGIDDALQAGRALEHLVEGAAAEDDTDDHVMRVLRTACHCTTRRLFSVSIGEPPSRYTARRHGACASMDDHTPKRER
jgi:hypothetical protein